MADEIVLTLTSQEVDKICTALAQRPWIEVNPLLQKIVQQAQQAIAGSTAAPLHDVEPEVRSG